MLGLPAFDGGFTCWCLVIALFCGGAGAAIAGWSRLNLGLSACGMVVLVIAGMWVAPALSQETGSDLQNLLQAAQARVDRQQADMVQWANSLQHRGDADAAQAAAVETASQSQVQEGAAMMDDPEPMSAASMSPFRYRCPPRPCARLRKMPTGPAPGW